MTAVAGWLPRWLHRSSEDDAYGEDKQLQKLYTSQGDLYDMIFQPRFGFILDHAGDPFKASLADQEDSKFLKSRKTKDLDPPGQPPTKTKVLKARTTFTFSCPTSVQCDDGGCCPLGDYCAIRNGQLGCCPIGSLCDASPIPGCTVYSLSLTL